MTTPPHSFERSLQSRERRISEWILGPLPLLLGIAIGITLSHPPSASAEQGATESLRPFPKQLQQLNCNVTGCINWTTLQLSALGVGSHQLLSPTGSWTQRELSKLAWRDAQEKLRTLLRGLPLTSKLALSARWSQVLEQLPARAMSATPLYLSDGSVHLPVSLSLSTIPLILSPRLSRPAAQEGGISALSETPVVLLSVPASQLPPTQLTPTVKLNRRRFTAGVAGSPLGSLGVRWLRGLAHLKPALIHSMRGRWDGAAIEIQGGPSTPLPLHELWIVAERPNSSE